MRIILSLWSSGDSMRKTEKVVLLKIVADARKELKEIVERGDKRRDTTAKRFLRPGG